MWSNKMFKQIGDRCGGFIKTEEETTLKNHLHWAQIKIHGDGKKVSREIELTSDGYVYAIPIWVESPVTVKSEKVMKEREKESFGLEVNGRLETLIRVDKSPTDIGGGGGTRGNFKKWINFKFNFKWAAGERKGPNMGSGGFY
uniref:Uncharacterized protein n=1 Tax=Solanum lycopersicum TaxID=4081 RepID=A0A3Q7GJC9_SOLLC